ncbi:hypothetical protein [Rhizosaccharibacter radicis]|uniref:Uncharacterized protein n=1 Tax=Rhizosaccharibacter radicis TaxID=2782605 RepID=A0ABT1VT02_9PROT|nr:hypothetical protein [Acetobacteraceae bacterium KSS12]
MRDAEKPSRFRALFGPHAAGRPSPRRWLALGAGLAAAAGALGAGLVFGRRQPARDDGTTGRGLPGTPPDAGAVRQGFEGEDDSGRGLFKGLAWLVAAAVPAVALMFGLVAWFGALDHQGRRFTPEQSAPIVPPSPHLQAHPFAELRAEQDQEHALISQYRWLDAAHTHARVPVERAMALVAGHSLEPEPDPAAPDGTTGGANGRPPGNGAPDPRTPGGTP